MAEVNWLRNKKGRVWVESLDGPLDRELTLEEQIAQARADMGVDEQVDGLPPATSAEPAPAAVRPELPPETRWQLVSALLIIAAMVLLALYALWPRAAERPTTNDRRPTTIASPPAPPAPTIAPAPVPLNGLPRAIVAYAAPGGAVLGPIEAGRAYTATARYGGDWIQLDVAQSGQIWTEAAPLGLDLAGLPDLTPPTPAPAPPAPAWQAPVEEPVAEPTDAPMVPAGPRYREDDPTVAPSDRNEMPSDRPPPPTRTAIVPKPPVDRPKPMQPPVHQDDTSLTNRLEQAGWPLAMVRRAVAP